MAMNPTSIPLVCRVAALTAVVAGSLFVTGCRSTAVGDPPLPTTPERSPASSVAEQPWTIADTVHAEASAEAVRHLNVEVRTDAKTQGGAATLADALRRSVEGQLANAGYRVSAPPPDIQVTLLTSVSEFDRSGNYLRYEGSFEVGVSRLWDQKKLGYEVVSIRGKRGLGAEAALRNLTAELTTPATDKVMQALAPAQSGLAAQDVTIRRPWLTTRDPQYAQEFIRRVKQQPGVVYCALVAQEYDTRTMVFRVVLLADAMPEGLLNRLATIRELNIKPRN